MNNTDSTGTYTDHTNITEVRNNEYKDAWLHCGEVMRVLQKIIYKSELFTDSPFSHNWVIILSKLFRTLHSPYKRDHWVDIIGYAKLVIDYIDEGYTNKGE